MIRGDIHVLYDRPPAHFRRSTALEYAQISQKYNLNLTYQSPNEALLVSSTSWTEDEDFSILLKALVLYEDTKRIRTELPRIRLLITGKGPLKAFYEAKIERLDLKFVSIQTVWLDIQDYPLLIGILLVLFNYNNERRCGFGDFFAFLVVWIRFAHENR